MRGLPGKVVTSVFAFACFLSAVNCSNVGFDKHEGDSAVASAGDPSDPDPGTPTIPAPNPPSSIQPKLIFTSPPCQRGTLCNFNLQLDKAYAVAVDFDWHTDDNAYQTPHTPVYGTPNVHYTPNGGHVRFEPGETMKSAQVQNINTQNIDIVIFIKISNCQTGGGPVGGCASYF